MKKIASIFLVLLFVNSAIAQSNAAPVYQIYYLKARTNPEIAAFYQYCKQHATANPLDKGYLGTATAMYAACAENVIEKFNFFNEGTSLLDQAVNQDPNNPELRFLRLSVQEKAPRMLNYNNNLEQDAQVIYQAFQQKRISKNSSFWEIAINFIKSAEQISAYTKSQFQAL